MRVGTRSLGEARPSKVPRLSGANGPILGEALSVRCNGKHERQPCSGTNRYGQRLKQKTVWPRRLRSTILDATLREANERSCATAFPAETREEEALEKGPLDGDDAEADDFEPVSNDLRKTDEAEQELLDSLRFSGFPKDEVERRSKWLALPRSARASIRRLFSATSRSQ